jgi:hypothetical protein
MENRKPGLVIPPKWDGKAAERIVDILSGEQRAGSREKKAESSKSSRIMVC